MQRYATLALHEAKHHFYTFTQDKHSTLQQYYEMFQNNIDVIEYCGGNISKDLGRVTAELTRMNLTTANAMAAQRQQAQAAARERALACALLFGSYKLRYGKQLEDLENDFVQGTDNYPETLQHAYTLLLHWKQDLKNVVRLISGIGDGLSFANVGRQSDTHKEVRRDMSRATVPSKNEMRRKVVKTESDDVTGTQLLLQGIEDLTVEDLYQFAHVDGHLPVTWRDDPA